MGCFDGVFERKLLFDGKRAFWTIRLSSVIPFEFFDELYDPPWSTSQVVCSDFVVVEVERVPAAQPLHDGFSWIPEAGYLHAMEAGLGLLGVVVLEDCG